MPALLPMVAMPSAHNGQGSGADVQSPVPVTIINGANSESDADPPAQGGEILACRQTQGRAAQPDVVDPALGRVTQAESQVDPGGGGWSWSNQIRLLREGLVGRKVERGA